MRHGAADKAAWPELHGGLRAQWVTVGSSSELGARPVGYKRPSTSRARAPK